MSLASEITNTMAYMSDSFDAVEAKGGTVTEECMSALADAIASISGGGGITLEKLYEGTGQQTFTGPAGAFYIVLYSRRGTITSSGTDKLLSMTISQIYSGGIYKAQSFNVSFNSATSAVYYRIS